MAKTKQNAVNDWVQYSTGITLDTAGGTGDIGLQFINSGTNAFLAGVQNSSGSFKISQGNALGTNDVYIVDNTRRIVKPLNSSAISTQPSLLANVTGNGAVFTIGTTTACTELKDQNNNMTTAGVFTAPATGKYLFSYAFLYAPNNVTGSTQTLHTIVTTARSYVVRNYPTRRRYTNYYGTNAYLAFNASLVASMTAGDTATWTFTGSGGSANSDSSISVSNIGATLVA